MSSFSVGQQGSQHMANEHGGSHKQSLEQPVPEKLHGHVSFVEAHDEEVGDHEEYRGHEEVGDL